MCADTQETSEENVIESLFENHELPTSPGGNSSCSSEHSPGESSNSPSVSVIADKKTSTRRRFQTCIAKGHAIRAMLALRVESMLRGSKAFQGIRPASIKKLAHLSKQAIYPEGSVIFREGDPPGNCYIVLSGQVAVFKSQSDETALEMDREDGLIETNEPELEKHKEDCIKKQRRSLSHPAIGEAIRQNLFSRHATAEGYSLYHSGSDLGVQVATLEKGDIFGELALLQHESRTASLKCLQDTELVIVEKHEFDNVLKAEMLQTQEEKLHFLTKHVPGMREAPLEKPGKPHASYFFRKISVQKGYEFFTQGQVTEEGFFVVSQGIVEFRRSETVSSSEPIRRKETRPTSRPCLLGRLSYEDATTTKTVRHVGSLLEGGVFGSLPITDVVEPEPFTVVAGTSVEVFTVPSSDISRLPRKLVDAIRESLVQATIGRLERLQSSRASCIILEKTVVGKASAMTKADFTRTLPLRGKLHLPLRLQQESQNLSSSLRRRCGSEPILKQLPSPDSRTEKAHVTFARLPSLTDVST